MSLVAGVDFGTLNVRVSIFDRERGALGHASAAYPLLRSASDPDFATQRHEDQMNALVDAMRAAILESDIDATQVRALALDTTGSSVIVVGRGLVPLDDYYLWCDHRAAPEAAEITAAAHAYNGGEGFEGIAWCGGVYSSEWGWSKLLHWLRHNPERRGQFVTALEHCDMVTATLCGITDPDQVPRSICAMGHKWMWNPRWGGLPPEDFLLSVDPILAGVRAQIGGRFHTSDTIAGHLSPEWALKLGLSAGIPIPVGAFDAHWDAVGANILSAMLSTSLAPPPASSALPPAKRSFPASAASFPAPCTRAASGSRPASPPWATFSPPSPHGPAPRSKSSPEPRRIYAPARPACSASPGTTATVPSSSTPRSVASPSAGTLPTPRPTSSSPPSKAPPYTRASSSSGCKRTAPRSFASSMAEASRSAITRSTRSTPTCSTSPVLVTTGDVTSLGSVIFAFLAAGDFATLEQAQDALCPPYLVFEPQPAEVARAERLYQLFRQAYFALGDPAAEPASLGNLLPQLRAIRQQTSAL